MVLALFDPSANAIKQAEARGRGATPKHRILDLACSPWHAEGSMRPRQAVLAALALLSGAMATPAAADDSLLAPSLVAANESLLWGSYRPGLYFGLRPRLPDTLMTGLIWFGVHDWQSYTREFRFSSSELLQTRPDLRSPAEPRHECDQRDGLTYSYTEHDGRSAAKQVIKDPRNNVQLTIRFIKVTGTQAGQGELAHILVYRTEWRTDSIELQAAVGPSESRANRWTRVRPSPTSSGQHVLTRLSRRQAVTHLAHQLLRQRRALWLHRARERGGSECALSSAKSRIVS